MSEKESQFIKWLSIIGGSLVVSILIGAFVFYATTIKAQSAQDEKNKNIEIRMQAQELKTETMRVEWREDIKEVKSGIDKIATRLNEQAGYVLKQGR